MSNTWEENENDNGDEMNEFEEREGIDFIDIKDLKERVEDHPLASYFLETRKNAKRRSALSWLEYCDDDTVALIHSYSKKLKESQDEKGEFSEAPENTSKDIFDDQPIETINTVDYNEDLYSLVALILAWENNLPYVDSNILSEATTILSMYVSIENLRRKGIVTPKGCGTLLSGNTDYVLTSKCKKMTKKELKEVLKSITDINKQK